MSIRVGLAAACVVSSLLASPVLAADEPGVTKTEIKIGGIFPFSGPASSIGLVGKGVVAYVQSINDRGGINGRTINYLAMDDAYSPPKAVEHARRLVESDEVSFIFGQLGTPGNSATAKYLKGKGVPSIAIVSGSSKFTDIAEYPLTTTGLVSYQTEGAIYAKFLDKTLPGAKYAILFQNDDLGKDYVNAFKSFLKGEFEKRVVTAAYEVTEPTVDSQVVNLKSSGAEALFIAGTPKFAAQAIRKAAEIGWKAKIIINFPSGSIGGTLKPAGLENSVGVIVGTINKDPTDSKWNDDEGVRAYKAFFARYLPGRGLREHQLSHRLYAGHDSRADTQAVRRRSLAKKYPETGKVAESCGASDRVSGDRGQYRRIQQHDLEPDAIAAVEWQRLGTVRRDFGRKFRMTPQQNGDVE